MKFSAKIERCSLSPIRKFNPLALEAERAGKTIYHLNIGQPDVPTPKEYFDAIEKYGV